jgi:hypothetical protein
MNEIVVKTFGNEFEFQSNLFQHFIYHVLEEKLKTHIRLQYIDGKFILTIYSIPNEEVALLINDVARVTKSKEIIYMYKYEPKVSDSCNDVKQVSRGYAVNSDYSLNVGLAPIHNTCPIRGNYIKLGEYASIKTGIIPQNDPAQLLLLVIKYDMKYIFNYIVDTYFHLFTNQVLKEIVKTGNVSFFKKALPLVKELETTTLTETIKHNRYDMAHDLLKLHCPVSTECVHLICTKDCKESQQLLTWINLYGNYSSVDFNEIIEGIDNIEYIKLLSQYVDSEFILNKAIYTNNLELFTAFVDSSTNLYPIVLKCIEFERLDMIKLVPIDGNMFNYIIEKSVKMDKQNMIEYILSIDYDIYNDTWKSLDNLESLCSINILVKIFDKCPDKPRMLLNAVCKNDLKSVEYIINHSDIYLVNFHDIVFRQALLHENKDVLKLLLSMKRVNSNGMSELLELVTNPELNLFLQESILMSIF